MTALTETQARQVVANIPGINVRRWRDTWHYEARYHSPGGKWQRRYAGQDLRRAVDLRAGLIKTYGLQT